MPFSRSVPPKKKRVTLVVSAALLLLLAAAAVVSLSSGRVHTVVRDISFTQLRELSQSGSAQKVSISGEVVAVTQADGVVVRGVVTNAVAQHEVVAAFEKAGVPVEFETLQPGVLVTALNYMLPAAAPSTMMRMNARTYSPITTSVRMPRNFQNDFWASSALSSESTRRVMASVPMREPYRPR